MPYHICINWTKDTPSSPRTTSSSNHRCVHHQDQASYHHGLHQHQGYIIIRILNHEQSSSSCISSRPIIISSLQSSWTRWNTEPQILWTWQLTVVRPRLTHSSGQWSTIMFVSAWSTYCPYAMGFYPFQTSELQDYIHAVLDDFGFPIWHDFFVYLTCNC